MLSYAEALARIAATGGGAQALASHLATAIDAGVLVEDSEWKHLALAAGKDQAVPPSVRNLLPDTFDGESEEGVA